MVRNPTEGINRGNDVVNNDTMSIALYEYWYRESAAAAASSPTNDQVTSCCWRYHAMLHELQTMVDPIHVRILQQQQPPTLPLYSAALPRRDMLHATTTLPPSPIDEHQMVEEFFSTVNRPRREPRRLSVPTPRHSKNQAVAAAQTRVEEEVVFPPPRVRTKRPAKTTTTVVPPPPPQRHPPHGTTTSSSNNNNNTNEPELHCVSRDNDIPSLPPPPPQRQRRPKRQPTAASFNTTQNPFQTAREVAQTHVFDDDNDDDDDDNKINGHRRNDPSHPAQNVHSHRLDRPPPPPLISTTTTTINNNPYHEAPPPPPLAIRASLKRKFQPPTVVQRSTTTARSTTTMTTRRSTTTDPPTTAAAVTTGTTNRNDPKKKKNHPSDNHNENDDDDDELPEELRIYGKELVEKIEHEIMDDPVQNNHNRITFDDIAGLVDQKQTVTEVVCWPLQRPDLFTGLRRAPNGLLLYGPPGTGKTLIGKAIAQESGATFFSISSSSLTSKWIGEGEKLVRVLFAVAAYRQPAVIFIDEIDSLLTQRKSDENEASRRIKTEFLIQLDGTGTSGQGRVLVIGATNRPQELDEAARRRFTKRLYIPLPEVDDREALIRVLLKTNHHLLSDHEIRTLAQETEGFSGADLKALSTDAAMGPIRQLGAKALEVDLSDVPPISYRHFRQSLKGMKPSVSPEDLVQYVEWDKVFGTKRAPADDDSDDDDTNVEAKCNSNS